MDVDRHLAMLKALPVPDLTDWDGADLAKRARHQSRQTQMITSMAIVAALFVGVAGSVLPSTQAEASIVPFGPPMALTPLVRLGRG